MTKQPSIETQKNEDANSGDTLLALMRKALNADATPGDIDRFHARLGDWLGRRVKIERPAVYKNRHNPDGSANTRYLLGAPVIKMAKEQGLLVVGEINRNTGVTGTISALELEQNGRITLERADIKGPKSLSTGLVVVEQVFERAPANPYAPYDELHRGEHEMQTRISISKVDV